MPPDTETAQSETAVEAAETAVEPSVENDKEPAPERTFTQTELNEIVQKQKAKAEFRAEKRATAAYKEALASVTQSSAQAARTSTPQRSDYTSDSDWIDAKVELGLAQRESERNAEKLTSSTERIYSNAEKIEGFDREAFDDLPLTAEIARALVESDVAPALMAYLVNNPQEVDRMAKLSGARQAAEIGKLEVKLENAVKKSSVPAPVSPIGAKGASTSKMQDMSFADYKKHRVSQGASWAR